MILRNVRCKDKDLHSKFFLSDGVKRYDINQFQPALFIRVCMPTWPKTPRYFVVAAAKTSARSLILSNKQIVLIIMNFMLW